MVSRMNAHIFDAKNLILGALCVVFALLPLVPGALPSSFYDPCLDFNFVVRQYVASLEYSRRLLRAGLVWTFRLFPGSSTGLV